MIAENLRGPIACRQAHSHAAPSPTTLEHGPEDGHQRIRPHRPPCYACGARRTGRGPCRPWRSARSHPGGLHGVHAQVRFGARPQRSYSAPSTSAPFESVLRAVCEAPPDGLVARRCALMPPPRCARTMRTLHIQRGCGIGARGGIAMGMTMSMAVREAWCFTYHPDPSSSCWCCYTVVCLLCKRNTNGSGVGDHRLGDSRTGSKRFKSVRTCPPS